MKSKKVFLINVLFVGVIIFGVVLFGNTQSNKQMPVNAETSGYYTYKVFNGVARITEVETSISGDVTIPSSLGGYPVVEIQYSAFSRCNSLTSVVIPDGVLKIEYRAFENCESLKSITIPNSVTTIEKRAFSGCKSLTSVVIPNSVTSVGECVFEYCYSIEKLTIPCFPNHLFSEYSTLFFPKSLKELVITGTIGGGSSIGTEYFANCEYIKSITLPEGINSIGNEAFQFCESLEYVYIPEGTIYIGEYAFSYCKSLKSITIPDSVTTIDESSFRGCSSLETVTLGNGITSISDYMFYDCTSLKSISIPKNVTQICGGAFSGCSSLESVELVEGLTEIGRAFFDCTALKSIVIPSSVTSIVDYAFPRCESFENIYISDNNSVYSDIEGVMYDKTGTILLCFPSGRKGYFEVPEKVTRIEEYAFSACEGLIGVTIPDSVTNIGYYAFGECSSLKSISIPNSVTSIGSLIFYDCTQLEKITLPYCLTISDLFGLSASRNGVKEIVLTGGDVVLAGFCDGCSYLTQITIPRSVKNIYYTAFSGALSLEDVYFNGTGSEWNKIGIGSYNDPLLNANIIFLIKQYCGDLNGDDKINSLDGLLLLRYLNGWDIVISNTEVMDVNKDGKVNSLDGLILARYLNGWNVTIG
ncbi:MAG: hypothetical protein E7384_05440 [Ruminococcaceae bacterium]|nr:hypothetical protein [Oscillospiraceae bacterium]